VVRQKPRRIMMKGSTKLPPRRHNKVVENHCAKVQKDSGKIM